MSNENSPPPTPSSPTARRASFAPGQKFTELFSRSPGSSGGAAAVSPYPGSIAAAANAQANQRRRMSISTLGLSGSPTQTSPFTNTRPRQDSYASVASSSGSPHADESAVEDGDAVSNNTPSSPFARRMSFGAKALRDVKGAANFNGRASMNSASSPIAKGRGDGFNWSDQLRSRAQRSSSITSPPNPSVLAPRDHQRAVSLAAVEPPVKEMPKAPKAPDYLQERILKGDFYMD